MSAWKLRARRRCQRCLLPLTLSHAEKTPRDAGATPTRLVIRISGWSTHVSAAAVAVVCRCWLPLWNINSRRWEINCQRCRLPRERWIRQGRGPQHQGPGSGRGCNSIPCPARTFHPTDEIWGFWIAQMLGSWGSGGGHGQLTVLPVGVKTPRSYADGQQLKCLRAEPGEEQ